MESLGIVFLAMLVVLLVFPIYTVWYGFVLSRLWAWLIVPIFHVRGLSIAQSTALGIVVTFLTQGEYNGNGPIHLQTFKNWF